MKRIQKLSVNFLSFNIVAIFLLGIIFVNMFILIDGVSGDKSLAYIGAGRLMNMRLNQNYCENNQIVFGMEDVIIFGIFFVISIGLAVFTRKKIYKYYTKT